MLWVFISLGGIAVGALNFWGTLRIWRSTVLETGQQVAQTVLVWTVPGSVLAILAIHADGAERHRADDPTARNCEQPNSDAFNGTTGHGPI
jgi:hypothetical protein